MKFIIEVALSVWFTSSAFMLWFWGTAFFTIFFRDGKVMVMPLGHFLYIHFCPIIHTVKCFQIMRRYATLKNENAECKLRVNFSPGQ